MVRSNKSFLNFIFLLSGLGGAASIIWIDSINLEWANLIPTYIIVLYAFIINMTIQKSSERDVAEYYSESIYFLGFLFTLIALVTLFSVIGSDNLLGSNSEIDINDENYNVLTTERRMILSSQLLENTFQNISIAITTSIAGIFLKNLIYARYIKLHPIKDTSAENHYEILKEIAEGLNGGYQKSIGAIGEYLDERKDLAGKIQEKEKLYIDGLDKFTKSIDSFSVQLSIVEKDLVLSSEKLGKNISIQAEGISEADDSLRMMTERIKTMRNESERINLQKNADDLATFGQMTSELNSVIDSLVEILDSKVEKLKI